MPVTVSLAQITPVWEDPGATLSKVRPLIALAADKGADLICFPEQFPTGWDPGSAWHAEPVGGSILTTLSEAAAEDGIAILGSLRLSEKEKVYNACVVIGPKGDIAALYKKIHLFSPEHEGSLFSPGTDIAIVPVGDMSFGLAICYDLRFPSLFHIYAGAGVDGVFVPAAWPASRMDAWEVFIRSRALENQMYLIGTNSTGNTPVDRYSGGSLVADPYGTIIAHAGEGEGLLYATLDSKTVEQARQSIPVVKDRKPDLYHSLYRKHRGTR